MSSLSIFGRFGLYPSTIGVIRPHLLMGVPKFDESAILSKAASITHNPRIHHQPTIIFAAWHYPFFWWFTSPLLVQSQRLGRLWS